MVGAEGRRACPFGGEPNRWATLRSRSAPPNRAYRVIPALVFAQLVWPRWLLFAGGRSVNVPVNAPLLAPPGSTGVYFTDYQSLQGLVGPADFARRLGLTAQAQLESLMHGCAVIEFTLPSAAPALVPLPAVNAQLGLTVGGAREWFSSGNVPIAHGMVVTHVYTTPTGHHWSRMTL